ASAAAGAVLPATTIRLGFIKGSLAFMHVHPILTAVAVVTLIVGGSIGVSAADRGQPATKKEIEYWTGPANKLLQYIDPAAPGRIAIDLDSIRTLSAATKPTSMFTDPAIAPTIEHIIKQFETWQAFQPNEFPPVWKYWESAHGV